MCLLTGYRVWLDAVELFIAWYSDAVPPLKARTKLWIWLRGTVGIAAIVTALATL
ncbi:MAG: hypothetical protein H6837_09860 [Planctomycetes bacterium]|nr:hypothetical protein [Planctomycetota bacterium]